MSLEFRCQECNLRFTSNAILGDHLAGKRHKRRLATLELSERNENLASTQLQCGICDVTVNSLIQFQAHLKGIKHNSKTDKTDPNALANIALPSTNPNPNPNPNPNTNPNAIATSTTTTVARRPSLAVATTTTAITDQAKKLIKKVPDAEKKPKESFPCDTCHTTMNSKSQFDNHVMSQKHKARLYGTVVIKKRNNFKNTNETKLSFKKSFVSAGVQLGATYQNRTYQSENYFWTPTETCRDTASRSAYTSQSDVTSTSTIKPPPYSYGYGKASTSEHYPLHTATREPQPYGYIDSTATSFCPQFDRQYLCVVDDPAYKFCSSRQNQWSEKYSQY